MAILTNPIWVVKRLLRHRTRPQRTGASSVCRTCICPQLELIFPSGNWNAPGSSVRHIVARALRALYHGTTLALVGVNDRAATYGTSK